MSEQKHTAGQAHWEYHPDLDKPVALVAGGRDVLLATGDMGRCWMEASGDDVERVKVCWNACDRAGLSNEALDADVITELIAIAEDVIEMLAASGRDPASTQTGRRCEAALARLTR